MLSRAPVDARSMYQLVAGGYAAIDPGWRQWFYHDAHKAFDEEITKGLAQGGSILDLGCGVGANTSRFVDLELPYASYMGVDISPDMLQRAQERYGDIPNIRFQQLDLMQDDLPRGPYDLITSTWVLEHLQDPVRVVQKAWEQLKPGGSMVLLFEDRVDTLWSRVINGIYPFFKAHLVGPDEYRKFPGKVVREDHFSGPFGDLALLVLEKTKS